MWLKTGLEFRDETIPSLAFDPKTGLNTVKKYFGEFNWSEWRPLTYSVAGKLLNEWSSEITYPNVTEISSTEVNLLLMIVISRHGFVGNLAI